MGAEEGMDRRGEHRISIVDNASGSGGRVGTEIDQEEVSSLPINSNVDEKWIRKLQEKVERAFPGSTHWPSQFVDETEPKICMFTMREEISRPRSVTKGSSLSQGWLHHKDKKSSSDCSQRLHRIRFKIRKRPSGYTLMPTMPDSARLLNLFRDNTTEVLDIIFHKDEIAPDLLIFDNQIPFFDNPSKARRHCIDEDSPPKFLHLLDLFHWSRVPKSKYIELSSSSKQLDSIDLARRSPNAMEPRETATMFGKKKPQQQDSINWARHTPNAMELTESATLFEKKTSGSSLDITFRRRWFKRIGGVLDIPELHIRDYSSFISITSSRSRCNLQAGVAAPWPFPYLCGTCCRARKM
uniref:Uncharacterized protein n=1 Tax=Ananas comosus var. bracteatus TaxID=296719 RepID=A0A6V7P0P6_ANACO|nr:unnamed protein product [Ananas comosus var. bracteatus]